MVTTAAGANATRFPKSVRLGGFGVGDTDRAVEAGLDWFARRKPDDPFPEPTLPEVDQMLRRCLPSMMVYALRPHGDPFTEWARAILGASSRPAAPDSPSVPDQRLREAAQALVDYLTPLGYPSGRAVLYDSPQVEALRAALASSRPAAPDSPDQSREALAEGLHKAMCFAPATMHNRLACERPQVYLALAEAALNHPAMREIVGVQQRTTDAAFGALSAVSDDLNAALSVSPRSDTALDVERLAYALNRAFGATAIGGPFNAIGANPMAAAERLATEYAALDDDFNPGLEAVLDLFNPPSRTPDQEPG